jgi:L-asparaginase
MKRDSTPAAFDADQGGRLGTIRGRILTLLQRPTGQVGGFALPPSLPLVPLLYAYADLDPALIDAAAAGADGLVIASVGCGTLRPDWIAAMGRARAAGTVVVVASRVPNTVVPVAEKADDPRQPFLAALHHTPPQARIQLMLALAETRDANRLQDMFEQS